VNCSACGSANPERAKFCLECGAALAAEPAREVRKTVTVVFCDVTGSTALGESTDPETVRALLGRYFERMREIVESHGGAVEKFIGDAVMAVFGVPVVHEDDALRAVRAALEMRDALPGLDIEARIGVNTGEVVAGTAERLATGDAVNVAARLVQAASPGQVLIGAETLRLVRDAVEVEPVELLAVKGKELPVEAYPLRALTGRAGVERRLEGAFVGRDRERRLLSEAFDLAAISSRCSASPESASRGSPPSFSTASTRRSSAAGASHTGTGSRTTRCSRSCSTCAPRSATSSRTWRGRCGRCSEPMSRRHRTRSPSPSASCSRRPRRSVRS
jgi:class 3 adenylate cyclase